MPLESIRSRTAEAIAAALAESFGHRPDRVDLEVPPRRELGDLAWPGALPLARVLRRAPRQIADAVASAAAWPDSVARVEVAGPGFVNIYLKRGRVLADLLRPSRRPLPASSESVIVEHTNINPNKAAHIGHLRNAVLGDTLVRCLRHLGHRVEVQNYIDDTGVQVADVVVGLLHLPETEIAACLGVEVARRDDLIAEVVARLAAAETVPAASVHDFDDLCWELYPRSPPATRATPTSPRAAPRCCTRSRRVPATSTSRSPSSSCAAPSSPPRRLPPARSPGSPLRSPRATSAATSRPWPGSGSPTTCCPHESDILHLGFWRRAFEVLREAGAIRLESEGKNAGCWVMSLEASPEFAAMDDPDKILVRSNGTVTYTGKDIAYQLWKLGLLEDPDGRRHDFGYAQFARYARAEAAAEVGYGRGDAAPRPHHLPPRRPPRRAAVRRR